MHRFFAFKKDGKISLDKDEEKHFRILRIEDNEKIELIIDNKIYKAFYKSNNFDITEEITKEPIKKIYLNVCIPAKLSTFEDIIDFAVQGGVFEIVPVICKRGFQDKAKILEKYDRFNKILKESIKQSRPSFLPRLKDVIYLKDVKPMGYGIVFDSFEKPNTKTPNENTYSIAIGPEGGFSKEELEILYEKGFNRHSLGDNILREPLAVFGAVFLLKNCLF